MNVIADHQASIFQEAGLVKIIYFIGRIGKHDVGANLTFHQNRIEGNYHDKNKGDISHVMGELKGVVDGEKVEIVETSAKAKERYFLGTFKRNSLFGTWTNSRCKEKDILQLTSSIPPDAPPLLILTDAHRRSNSHSSSLHITKLKVVNASSHQELQLIKNIDAQLERNEVIIEDMNFDRYPDIRLVATVGYVNQAYLYWLYDPTLKKFKRNKELEDFAVNPQFDPVRKSVSTSGISGYTHFGERYLYKGGKYFLTERFEIFWDEKQEQHLIATRYTIKNGESVEISREIDPDVVDNAKSKIK